MGGVRTCAVAMTGKVSDSRIRPISTSSSLSYMTIGSSLVLEDEATADCGTVESVRRLCAGLGRTKISSSGMASTSMISGDRGRRAGIVRVDVDASAIGAAVDDGGGGGVLSGASEVGIRKRKARRRGRAIQRQTTSNKQSAQYGKCIQFSHALDDGKKDTR